MFTPSLNNPNDCHGAIPSIPIESLNIPTLSIGVPFVGADPTKEPATFFGHPSTSFVLMMYSGYFSSSFRMSVP